MRNKKTNAQFAIEFIVLIAFMFLIFLGVIAVITSKVIESKETEKQKIAEDIAKLVQNEIELAKSMTDGYVRIFNLPIKVQGNSYSIQIIADTELVVDYLDKEYVTFLPENVEGDVSTGSNEIKKDNGIVYLEHIAECDDGIDNDGDGFCDYCMDGDVNGDGVCDTIGSEVECTDGSTPGDDGCIDLSDNDETNCGDGSCEGFENCLSCVADCGTCISPGILMMKGASGNAGYFKKNGNVILKGALTQGIAPAPTASDEFIFKNSLGAIVAIINLDNGDMFIQGTLYERESTLSPSGNDFIVKYEGNVISYIDESGNFHLKGSLTQNGNP